MGVGAGADSRYGDRVGAGEVNPALARRTPIASRHAIHATESGLVVLELFDCAGRPIVRYERLPEGEAHEFIAAFEEAWAEARRAYHRPSWERR